MRKPIPGYAPYEADDDGHIWKGDKRISEILHHTPRGHDYFYVNLRIEGSPRAKFKTVHRLVALAFHGPPPFPKAQVLHAGDHKDDNRPSNLRWDTAKANVHEALENGLLVGTRKRLTPEAIRSIQKLHEDGFSTYEIAREVGVTRVTVIRSVEAAKLLVAA